MKTIKKTKMPLQEAIDKISETLIRHEDEIDGIKQNDTKEVYRKTSLYKSDPSKTWRGKYKGIHYEIVSWRIEMMGPVWNYYIYLMEKDVPNFESIWLPDVIKIMPGSGREYVDNDYYGNEKICSIDMHGGITFYEKNGYTKGHRNVKIGCDYQHLNDMESGYSATLESVVLDAEQTIDDAISKLGILVKEIV